MLIVYGNAKELVLNYDPNAFEDDNDGEWVRIKTRRDVTEPCPHCKQSWTHKVVTRIFGSGGNSSEAWKSAAKNLGLMCRECEGTGLFLGDAGHGYCNCPTGRQLAQQAMVAGEHGL